MGAGLTRTRVTEPGVRTQYAQRWRPFSLVPCYISSVSFPWSRPSVVEPIGADDVSSLLLLRQQRDLPCTCHTARHTCSGQLTLCFISASGLAAALTAATGY